VFAAAFDTNRGLLLIAFSESVTPFVTDMPTPLKFWTGQALNDPATVKRQPGGDPCAEGLPSNAISSTGLFVSVPGFSPRLEPDWLNPLMVKEFEIVGKVDWGSDCFHRAIEG